MPTKTFPERTQCNFSWLSHKKKFISESVPQNQKFIGRFADDAICS